VHSLYIAYYYQELLVLFLFVKCILCRCCILVVLQCAGNFSLSFIPMDKMHLSSDPQLQDKLNAYFIQGIFYATFYGN